MKLLTLNFLACARKSCKPSPSSFPLHPQKAVLEIVETDINPLFLRNILPRLDWPALLAICSDLGLPGLVETMPSADELFEPVTQVEKDDQRVLETPVWTQETAPSLPSLESTQESMHESMQGISSQDSHDTQDSTDGPQPSQLARDLHRLLMETCVLEGELKCASCDHVYAVKEGIPNFLLPPHMV